MGDDEMKSRQNIVTPKASLSLAPGFSRVTRRACDVSAASAAFRIGLNVAVKK